MLALNLGKALEDLERVKGKFDATSIAERGEGGEGNSRQDFARRSSRKIGRQTQGRGIVPQREIAQRLDKASPVQARIHQERGAYGVDVIESVTPVQTLQSVGCGGIVVH